MFVLSGSFYITVLQEKEGSIQLQAHLHVPLSILCDESHPHNVRVHLPLSKSYWKQPPALSVRSAFACVVPDRLSTWCRFAAELTETCAGR